MIQLMIIFRKLLNCSNNIHKQSFQNVDKPKTVLSLHVFSAKKVKFLTLQLWNVASVKASILKRKSVTMVFSLKEILKKLMELWFLKKVWINITKMQKVRSKMLSILINVLLKLHFLMEQSALIVQEKLLSLTLALCLAQNALKDQNMMLRRKVAKNQMLFSFQILIKQAIWWELHLMMSINILKINLQVLEMQQILKHAQKTSLILMDMSALHVKTQLLFSTSLAKPVDSAQKAKITSAKNQSVRLVKKV